MSEFINTRDLMGDQACADAICDRTITELHDNKIATVGYRTFYGCPNLTSVKLPSLRRIEENGFFNCQNINSMDLGQVYFIGDRALDCPNLKELYLRNTDAVCTYNSTAINYYPGRSVKDEFVIYVPSNLVSAYANSVWAQMAATITAIPEARSR